MKLSGKTYEIQYVEEFPKDENQVGEIDYLGQVVKIRTGMHSEMVINTIMHEALHHHLFHNLGQIGEHDEEVVSHLSNFITSFILENKELVRSWL